MGRSFDDGGLHRDVGTIGPSLIIDDAETAEGEKPGRAIALVGETA